MEKQFAVFRHYSCSAAHLNFIYLNSFAVGILSQTQPEYPVYKSFLKSQRKASFIITSLSEQTVKK